MAFARPTLSALVTRVTADLRTGLGIAGPLLRRAMADVLAKVWAGTVHMLHGHLTYLGKQLFPDISDFDFLLRQASIYDIKQTPATFAEGTLTLTGTPGSTALAGTIFVYQGRQFRLEDDSIMGGGGNDNVTTKAVLAGSSGNVPVGEVMTIESPISGINSTATVFNALVGGFDTETEEEIRDKVLLRLQEPPEGGSDADYLRWSLDVAGVTRAWVYRHENGLGTVVVRFVTDEEDGTVTFPDVDLVEDVQNALDAQRPTTAEVTAVAPTALAVNFTIDLTPDTADLRAAVTAELADMLRRDAEPNGVNHPGTILLSHIRTAIGNAVGEGNYALTVPSADVAPTLGQLATMGTITWL